MNAFFGKTPKTMFSDKDLYNIFVPYKKALRQEKRSKETYSCKAVDVAHGKLRSVTAQMGNVSQDLLGGNELWPDE